MFLARAEESCLGPWLLLRLADIAHRLVDVDVAKGEHKQPAYRQISPTGSVPALRDGELMVWGSAALMRYVCNRYTRARRFYPLEPTLRARCDQALEWRESHWSSHILTATGPALGLSPPDADRERAASDALTNEGCGSFRILVDHFLAGSRPFVCGEEVTIADLAIAPAIKLLSAATAIDVPPRVMAYAERFADATAAGKWHDILDGEGGWGINQLIAQRDGTPI